MSLTTHSKFYYGFEVTEGTQYLDFDEGGAELTAVLTAAKYTLRGFAAELARAMNALGGQAYTVTVDRTSRKLTISAAGNFTLRVATGTHTPSSIFETAGFTGANRTGANTYQGNLATGTEYKTQFILQSYVAPEDQTGAVYSAVNKSANGQIEAVTYGQESIIDMNLRFVNDNDNGGFGPIRTVFNGVAQLRAFMNYLVTKGPFEFMPDESDADTFYSVVLESTKQDKNGTKFLLDEMYEQGLPGYFETGVLKLRVIQ